MTDIVERLCNTVQTLATTQMNLSMEDWDKVSNAVLDAAGAIKRLRGDVGNAAGEITGLRAENRMLREALHHIAWGQAENDQPHLIARAALDSQPAPSGWRPIETAPKTRDDNRFGPLIVLASTSGHWAIGYWAIGYWGERCGRWGWVNPHDHQIMDYWNAFTHWMPLPPAPGEEEA